MAGRKQHFIPQQFLRNFSIPEKSTHVYTYRKKAKFPFQSAISDTAAMRDFYSEPSSEFTLDDKITNLEMALDPIVKKMSTAPNDDVETMLNEYLELMIHLEVRTRHTREFMSKAFGELMNSLANVVGKTENLSTWLGIKDGILHKKLDLALKDELAQYNFAKLTNLQESTIERLSSFFIREKFHFFISDMSLDLKKEVRELLSLSPSSVVEAHRKALDRDLGISLKRINKIKSMNWKTVEFKECNLILPDCISIARSESGMWSSGLFPESYETVVERVFPIKPNRALIGLKNDTPMSSEEDIINASIGCSTEFFVTHKKTFNSFEEIGKLSEKHITGMISSISKSIIKEEGMTPPPSSLNGYLSGLKRDKFNVPNYQVKFSGGVSPEEAKDIAGIIEGIVNIFGGYYPLGYLSEINYTIDLREALRTFDAEHEMVIEPPSNNDNYIGVSATRILYQDSEIAIYPFISLEYGLGLISNEKEYRDNSTTILLWALANISLKQIMSEALNNNANFDDRTNYDKLLDPYCGDAFTTYWSSRISSGIKDNSWEMYEGFLLKIIENALTTTPNLLKKYDRDKDIDSIFENRSKVARDILLMAARVAGHLDEENLLREPSSNFISKMKDIDLYDWFCLFRADLNRIFCTTPNWKGFSEFSVFNRHFERICFILGIVTEDTDHEGLFIKVRLPS